VVTAETVSGSSNPGQLARGLTPHTRSSRLLAPSGPARGDAIDWATRRAAGRSAAAVVWTGTGGGGRPGQPRRGIRSAAGKRVLVADTPAAEYTPFTKLWRSGRGPQFFCARLGCRVRAMGSSTATRWHSPNAPGLLGGQFGEFLNGARRLLTSSQLRRADVGPAFRRVGDAAGRTATEEGARPLLGRVERFPCRCAGRKHDRGHASRGQYFHLLRLQCCLARHKPDRVSPRKSHDAGSSGPPRR